MSGQRAFDERLSSRQEPRDIERAAEAGVRIFSGQLCFEAPWATLAAAARALLSAGLPVDLSFPALPGSSSSLPRALSRPLPWSSPDLPLSLALPGSSSAMSVA